MRGRTPTAVALLLLAQAVGMTPAHALRPFDGTDASVAELGEFELEFGPLQYLRSGGRVAWIATALVANWGMSGAKELVLETQLKRERHPEPGVDATSFVDTAISIKQVLRTGSLQDRSGPSVASECGALIPDSNPGSHLGFACAAVVSQRLGPGALHLNLALLRTRERRTGNFVSIIAEAPSVRSVRPVLEVLREQDGYATSKSLLVGAIWSARDDLSLDMGVRTAHGSTGTSQELRAGLTWRYAAP